MEVVIKEKEITWKPHPTAKGVEIKVLLSKKEHGTDITLMLVKGRKGAEVPEHVHENADDIIYPISGKFKMWVEGTGEIEVEKGRIIRVPKGVKHKVYGVDEDYVVLDIFSPAIM